MSISVNLCLTQLSLQETWKYLWIIFNKCIFYLNFPNFNKSVFEDFLHEFSDNLCLTWPKGYKQIFMLNSAGHEIFPALLF